MDNFHHRRLAVDVRKAKAKGRAAIGTFIANLRHVFGLPPDVRSVSKQNKEPSSSGNVDNRNSPINALPAELFLYILLETVNFEYQLASQLHTLAQVCSYWFHSILSNPGFWRVIDFSERDHAPMVIRRNPDGPLAVRCWGGEDATVKKFLEVAREQTHRWDMLDLDDYREDLLPFVNAPTPALVTLNVTNVQDESITFPLFVTSTLRHVQVYGTRLPWDSPSLTGLTSISIVDVDRGGPSLRQIITLLTAPPALEWFALGDIQHHLQDDTEVPERTISLPALRGLYLRNGPTYITCHLPKTIDAPQCHILEATVPYQLIQNPGPTFGKLAAVSMPAAECLQVAYYGSSLSIRIAPSTILCESPRGGWRSEGSEYRGRVRVSVQGIPYSSNALDSVVNILNFQVAHSSVLLRMYGSDDGGAPEPAQLFKNLPSVWNSVTHLYFSASYGSQRITSDLRFIATPIIENGRARWPCSRLTSLEFERTMLASMAKEVAHAVLYFLEKRSAAGREADITWDVPVPLECLEAGEGILCVLRGAEAAKGVKFLVDDRW